MKRARSIFVRHLWRHSASKKVIEQDVLRWVQCLRWEPTLSVEAALVMLMTFLPEYRSLFYKRLEGSMSGMRMRRLAMILFPGESSLRIETNDIGGGCFIQHGVATVIAAQFIGSNAWINQQVTIGWKDGKGAPRLGDNVTINAGAIVLGNIEIGNGAVVGAGALVLKSVPPACTVVGNPARIIRRDGVRVDEAL